MIEDTYKQDPYKQDPYKPDPYKQQDIQGTTSSSGQGIMGQGMSHPNVTQPNTSGQANILPSGTSGGLRNTIDVFVTGSTGKEGFGVMMELLTGSKKDLFRVRGAYTHAGERRRADYYERLGAQMVEFDANKPSNNLISCMQGCKALVLIVPSEDNRVQLAKNIIMAAEDANISHTVLISSLRAHRQDSSWARMFWEIEQSLRNSQKIKNFTILRSTFLMSNFLMYRDMIANKGQISLPIKNGYLAPLDAGDLGRSTVAVLSKPEVHFGRVFELTGPKAKNLHGIAKDIGKAFNKKITPVDVSVNEARIYLRNAGCSLSEIEGLLDFFYLVAQGETYYVSPDYSRLTGLRGVTVTDYFLFSRDIFGGSSSMSSGSNVGNTGTTWREE